MYQPEPFANYELSFLNLMNVALFMSLVVGLNLCSTDLVQDSLFPRIWAFSTYFLSRIRTSELI